MQILLFQTKWQTTARLGASILFGWVPSLLFFMWVERNMALPYLAQELGWPWLSLPESLDSVGVRAAVNATLFLVFGWIHTRTARPGVQRPEGGFSRSEYVLLSGVALFFVMAFWQPTGALVWVLPLPWALLQILSFVLYWGLLLAAAVGFRRFDALAFLGLRRQAPPEKKRPPQELATTGLYGRIRHPIYFFTLLAFAVAPMMSLDRLVLTLALMVYLAIAIPVEERKLVAEFGQAYEDYRRKVPAVFPRLRQ